MFSGLFTRTEDYQVSVQNKLLFKLSSINPNIMLDTLRPKIQERLQYHGYQKNFLYLRAKQNPLLENEEKGITLKKFIGNSHDIYVQSELEVMTGEGFLDGATFNQKVERVFQNYTPPEESKQQLYLNDEIPDSLNMEVANQSLTASQINNEDTSKAFTRNPEDIQQMEDDYMTLPECAERSLICLIYKIWFNVGKSEQKPDLTKLFSLLNDQLREEELLTDSIATQISVGEKLYSSRDYLDSAKKLECVRDQLRPLHLDYSFKLIEKQVEQGQVIKGKDIIALLSPSGWGKSTTFLHLAKQEMVRVIGENGLPHIQSKNVTDPILKEVVSTNQFLSASRSIIPFLIDEEQEIYLVDTIGAGDTGGAALDLANGIGMIEAFKNASSIRVVLLINGKDTGKRFQGVNKFIKIITGLIPDLEGLIKNKSITCLFTDYLDLSQGKPSQEQFLEAQKLINDQFKAKKSQLTPEEELDTGFTKFIKFIVDLTTIDSSKKKEGALIVDPIYGDNAKLLKKLLKLKPLKRLRNFFKFSISLETRLKIDQQVSLHLKAITNALNRNAFELLELKLNELLTLSRYLYDPLITQNYEDSVNTITKHLSTCFQRAYSQIDKGLASENELTPEEVKNYKEAFDKQRRLDSLSLVHFKDFSLSSDTYSAHIQLKIKEFENEILKVDQLNNPSLPKKMSKLKYLEKEFFSEDCSFKKMVDHLNTLLVNDLTEARGFIEEKDFVKFSDQLHYLEEANKSVSVFLPHLKDSVPQLIEAFHQKIQLLKNEANQLISLENFEYNDADSLNLIFHQLSVGNSLLQKHKLDQNIIKSAQSELQENLVQVFNQHSSIIETEKATMAEGFMERIRLSLVYQDKLIKISKLHDKVYKAFDDNLSKVIWLIKDSKMHVDAIIKDITDGKNRQKAQYDILYTSLQALKDANWIEKFKEGTFKDEMKSVIEKIKNFTEDLGIKASKNKLDSFASHKKLSSASKNISQLKYMMKFISFEPALEKTIQDCCSRFENQIKDVLDQISTNFVLQKIKTSSSKQIVYEEAENALLYLTILEEINLEQVLSGKNLSDFKKFLSDYQQMVKEEAIASFKTITNHTTCESSSLMYEQYCILYNRLNELVNMQDSNSFPQILKMMQSKLIILKEIKERHFMSYLDNISDELNQKLSAKLFEEALNLINELRILKDLDPLLEGQLNFKDLYKEFSNRIRQSDAPGLARDIKDALNDGDYSSVVDKMPKLKTSQLQTKYDELIRDINKYVKDLSDSTWQSMKSFYVYFDGGSRLEVLLPQLDALMKKLQNAKDELLPLLDENHKSIILRGEELQKEIVLEGIKKLLDKYTDYIKHSKFSESGKMRIMIEHIHSSEQRKIINQSHDVYKQIQELDLLEGYCLAQKDKQIIESEFKDLRDLRLVEYISSLNQANIQKYIQAGDSAIQLINRKFLEELNKVRKINSADLPAKRKLLKNIKNQVRSCCPENLKADIEINIRDEEELITSYEEQRKLDLQGACDTKSYSELSKFQEEFTLQQNRDNIFLINNFVNKEGQSYHESIKSEESSTAFLLELSHFNTFLKATMAFKVQTKESESKIKQLVKSRFLTSLQKLEQSFRKNQEPQNSARLRFLSMSSLIDSNSDSEYTFDSQEEAKDSINNMKEFIILQKSSAEHQLILDDYLPNYSDLSEKISSSIVTFFKNQQENFQKALGNEKIDELGHILSTMKSRDKEMKILKDNINSSEGLRIIVESLSDCLSYSDMQCLLAQFISTFQKEIASIDLSSMIHQFEAKRQQDYRKIRAKFDQSGKLDNLKHHLPQSSEVKTLRDTYEKKLLEQLEILQREALKHLNNKKQDKDSLSLLSQYYKGLKEVLKIMQLEDKSHKEKLDHLTTTILQRVEQLSSNAQADLSCDNLSTCLIQMKMIAEYISEFSSTIDALILEILNLFKTKKGTTHQIKLLGNSLDGSHTGNLIIEQFSIFKIYLKGEWKKKTEGHNITYVLGKIKGDGICKQSLQSTFDEFTTAYEDLVTKALKQANNIQGVYETLIAKIRLLSGSIPKHHETLTNDQYGVIPELLANICTLFTLVTSEEYFDEKGSDMQDYLTTLHTGQVIAIFRLLGMGDETEVLQNNLVQIGTGEGKSYVIGLLAILMALLGFDVSCACYSKYLSERDKLSFSKLITMLSLNQYIEYGTFNEICESLISKKGNVRDLTLKVLNEDDYPKLETSASKRLSVLIIDEYDTLLNNSLYLNMFNPSIQLTGPSIKALLDLIWGKRNGEYSFQSIKSSPQFQQCLKNYVGMETLFEEILKQILSDLKDFESQPLYKIKEDKIYYKDQDGLSDKISYGYKTLFALYKANEAKQISDACLEKNQCFVLKCGSYSYAVIPKKFNFILGVTGTLESLRPQEIEINRKEYKISKSTILPSVFGKNNLDFIPSRDIRVEASEDYENALVEEIKNRRQSRGINSLRPVIVFFRNKSELEKFYNSPIFAEYKEKAKILTEDASPEEKNQRVKEATQSGQILLATVDFGRGTDFKIRDPLVLSNDGAHVLIAFFPPDLSSQIQMIGRVARQGEKGSASMIINQDSLEEYNIPPQEVAEYQGKLDVVFNAKRDASFQSEYESNMKWLDGIKTEHQQSEEFLELLSSTNSSKSSVLPYLIKFNKGAYNELNPCKTMILIDLTISMNELLQKLKSVIGILCSRVDYILGKHNIEEGAVKIQIVFYRNYNSKEDEILISSPWEAKAEHLMKFLNQHKVQGGWKREAIEIGLWHANQESETVDGISQVILIGDSPSNTPQEVTFKRKTEFTEEYWASTKFREETDESKELEKLITKGIKVHAFYLNELAKECFINIAKRTGGRHEFLDLSASQQNMAKSGNQLANFICEEILNCVGETRLKGEGEKLRKEYQEKFAKSYV